MSLTTPTSEVRGEGQRVSLTTPTSEVRGEGQRVSLTTHKSEGKGGFPRPLQVSPPSNSSK